MTISDLPLLTNIITQLTCGLVKVSNISTLPSLSLTKPQFSAENNFKRQGPTFQTCFFLLLFFFFTPSIVQSNTGIISDSTIEDLQGKTLTSGSIAQNELESEYLKLQLPLSEIGFDGAMSLLDNAEIEPPDQDGFLGRYTVLVKDIVYLLPVGAVVIGAIYLMPEEVSNWDQESNTPDEIWSNWKDNVTHWVWDEDDTWLNLIGHPYFGSAYVVHARHYGYSKLESFWYSFAASLFYEVALEGWAEPVSKQDVILTPFLGFVLSEFLLPLEARIKKNNNCLFNSSILGNVSLFLIDPFGYAIRPVKRLAAKSGWLRDAEFNLSPTWQGKPTLQFENTTGKVSHTPCYGLFLTVNF